MDPTLARVADGYFRAHFAGDPFAATSAGVAGYDHEVPDPSREAADRQRARLADLAAALSDVDSSALAGEDRISHAMLTRVLRDEQATLRAGLEEVAITAGMTGTLAQVVSTVPIATVGDAEAAEAYLSRLSKLDSYADAMGARHQQAAAEGRLPTAIGVQQAIDQLDAYLATPVERDPLLRVEPGPDVDSGQWQARAAELVATVVRPAFTRYRAVLAGLLASGRPEDRVGVCHVPGGGGGYLGQVRAHTTTDLTPRRSTRSAST